LGEQDVQTQVPVYLQELTIWRMNVLKVENPETPGGEPRDPPKHF